MRRLFRHAPGFSCFVALLVSSASHADGPAIGWGRDGFGRASPPASVDGTDGTASAIAAGSKHALAIQVPEPGGGVLRSAVLVCLAFLAARKRRHLVYLWLLVVGIACERPPSGPIDHGPAAPEPACAALRWDGITRKRDVVLILNDAMRRDRVGIYGGPARTPVFDEFSRQNIYFTQAYTNAPWTKPSIATLFTGLYPSQHDVVTDPWLPDRDTLSQVRSLKDTIETDLLGGDLVTLAEVLHDAGYLTAAVVSNPWLKREFGFAQGFGFYHDALDPVDTPGQRVNAVALDWLRKRPREKPYFLYLHYMDSHNPYGRLTRAQVQDHAQKIASDQRPAPTWTIENLARYEDGSPVVGDDVPPTLTLFELIYDKGIENFDGALGELFEELTGTIQWEETAVLIVSDHGEALGTRGWTNHGFGLFDDELAVPFAARLPGVSADNPVQCLVALIDVSATLCVYLGLECPEPNFGVSFLHKRSSSPRKSRYVVSEAVVRKPQHRAIRTRGYKLLFEPEGRSNAAKLERPFSLFAIAEDPDEQHDLLAAEPRTPETDAIFKELVSALRVSVPPLAGYTAERVPIDEETQKRLQALGYLE